MPSPGPSTGRLTARAMAVRSTDLPNPAPRVLSLVGCDGGGASTPDQIEVSQGRHDARGRGDDCCDIPQVVEEAGRDHTSGLRQRRGADQGRQRTGNSAAGVGGHRCASLAAHDHVPGDSPDGDTAGNQRPHGTASTDPAATMRASRRGIGELTTLGRSTRVLPRTMVSHARRACRRPVVRRRLQRSHGNGPVHPVELQTTSRLHPCVHDGPLPRQHRRFRRRRPLAVRRTLRINSNRIPRRQEAVARQRQQVRAL